MRKSGCTLAILALALLTALPASAQNRRASVELGVFGGYRVFDADIDDDFTLGAHVGVNFTDRAEVEVRYSSVDTEGGPGIEVDLENFSVGFLWNYHPEGRITSPKVPYFAVGVGRSELENFITLGDNEPIDEFDYLFIGGGFRYFYNEWFGLRWDVRTLLWGEDGDLGEFDEVDFEASIGLTFVLGGR